MEQRVEKPADLKFHCDAFEFAKMLMEQGKTNCDGRNWTVDQPTPADEDAYLKAHGFTEYGKWFLATKVGTDKNTKQHYEFPIGNFKKIFRSGVVAAKARAGQFKHHEIEKAAAELLELLDKHSCSSCCGCK